MISTITTALKSCFDMKGIICTSANQLAADSHVSVIPLCNSGGNNESMQIRYFTKCSTVSLLSTSMLAYTKSLVVFHDRDVSNWQACCSVQLKALCSHAFPITSKPVAHGSTMSAGIGFLAEPRTCASGAGGGGVRIGELGRD